MSILRKPEYPIYKTQQHIFSRLIRRDRTDHIQKIIHSSNQENVDANDSL